MAHSKHNTRTDPASVRYKSSDRRTQNKLRKIRKCNGPEGEREAQKWLTAHNSNKGR